MAGKILVDDPNRPDCPHCARPMMVNGVAESGRRRYRCHGCGFKSTGSPESHLEDLAYGYDLEAAADRAKALRRAIRNGANRFVITTAVNNTPVDKQAFAALLRLCEDRRAHLIVIPAHYKNVSLYTGNEAYEKWWDPLVQPYLVDQAIKLTRRCTVRAEIRIQATAAQPLTTMAPLAGSRWVVFGHPQMALEPVPTPLNKLPGRMYTTGAITRASYSQTKLGAKAEFHHVIGALLIEAQGRRSFVRQLNFDRNGTVYDLTDHYREDRIDRGIEALSLTTGDEHVKFMLPAVKKATYMAEDSIVRVTRPQYIVRHDILDGYAGSHHHIGKYELEFRKWLTGDADYRAELDQVVDHINETTPTDWPCQNALVSDSNHHKHLQMWLDRADDRKDHLNADLIAELRMEQRQAIREGRRCDPFELYLRPRLTVPALFLSSNQPFLLGGVDFSQHGDRGANGARGTTRALANTTHRMTIGHSHTARIDKSIYQVGKSTGTLEYESGLSSHTNTHCLQYLNGKRTLIDILSGGWRATNEPNDGGLEVVLAPESIPEKR